jgi:cell division protein FtsL
MIVGMLVLIVGLIYVAQGTQATNYDYELSAVDDEIAELEARKEDLAVEKARLTSIASTENSEVANNMETATNSGFVAE